ncbi:MAG: hypothetical protein WCJ39_02485 [bacterium]
MITLVCSLCLKYDTQHTPENFLSVFRATFPRILSIIKKYIWLFIPIGALRAISTAIGQKMLEIGIDIFNKVPKHSILIIVISII